MRRPIDDASSVEPLRSDRRSRRSYLAAIATAGAVGLAGCGGGGGGGGGDDNDSADGGTGMNSSAGTGDGGDTGGCGPDTIEFEPHEFRSYDGAPLVSSEIPSSASVAFENQVSEITISWGDGTSLLTYGAQRVDATIQEYEESGEFENQVEISDRFDLQAGGARVYTHSSYEGEDLPPNSTIYLPVDDGSIPAVIANPRTSCRDATVRAYERLVAASQPI